MKLSSREKELVNSKFYDLTEEDKLKRKKLLYKINDIILRKNKNNNKKEKRANMINMTDKIILGKNRSIKEKINTCKKTGLYLINNGREKLGLQYISESIKYSERLYGNCHHRVFSAYNFYNILYNRVDSIIKGRKKNTHNI